ncbi:MAG: type II toxin-antitoxin system VapC family toxin [Candidatus Korobacteraceae bacterium]
MALYYFDTSALVKLYVREAGSDRVLALAACSAGNQMAILSLAQVELRSAIRKREKSGDIPSRVATEVIEAFQRHLESRFTTQTITDLLLDIACLLVDRHQLRAFDAIQLAGYMMIRGSAGSDLPFFVCSDHELLAAAEQEGAPIFDPCS